MAESGGGALKEELKRKLTRLWTGELAAVVMLWVCFFTLSARITDARMLCSIALPLGVLSLILIQGSVYWWILTKRLSVPRFAARHTGRVYGALRIVDALLLCAALVSIIVNHTTVSATIISALLWGFALIEWINYFKLRLSYSRNPLVLSRRVKNGELQKSRIAEEIENGFGG